jgi:hypothetical protein
VPGARRLMRALICGAAGSSITRIMRTLCTSMHVQSRDLVLSPSILEKLLYARSAEFCEDRANGPLFRSMNMVEKVVLEYDCIRSIPHVSAFTLTSIVVPNHGNFSISGFKSGVIGACSPRRITSNGSGLLVSRAAPHNSWMAASRRQERFILWRCVASCKAHWDNQS